MTNLNQPFRPPIAALALVLFSGLGAIGWLWWTNTRASDINFLPRLSSAEWILSPSVPEVTPHPRVNLGTVFKRSFVLSGTPAKAELRIAGFHEYSFSINGAPMPAPSRVGRNWKEPGAYDVTRLLRPGENEISVRVSNTNAPAAFWLSLVADGFQLKSDETWKASCEGAEWAAARFASLPPPDVAGGPLSGGEQPGASLRARWPSLLLFAVLSAAIYFFGIRWRQRSATAVGDAFARWRSELLPLLALAGVWVVLFVINLSGLPLQQGFDAEGHLAYVTYILDRHALPLANEGWEMFQPPLYYLGCAGLLKILGLHTWQDEGIIALRFLGLFIGVAHFTIVWACLRLLFPEDHSRQMWGTLLAACLPVVLYLSQYITNEAAAATEVSLCVYLTLRALKTNRASWRLCAMLGVCLGAALLTKITAVLLVPLVIVALLSKGFVSKQSAWSWSARVALVLALGVLVCGWHYARVHRHLANASMVVWIPNTEIAWWQENGFRTGAFFLHFGRALTGPWYSAYHSFADGIYSTLWGDGLFSGSGDFALRPPWNYDLMAVGYWLALLPTLGVLIGAVMAVAKFIRQPSAEWLLLLGLGFLAAFAVARISLTVPYCSVVKAFYGLAALVPFCACGALGLDFLSRRARGLRPVICILFGVWAINSFAAFCVSGTSTAAVLSHARNLAKAGRANDAIQILAAGLAADPQSTELHRVLAEILVPLGQGQDALNHAGLAVSENPIDAASRLALAMSFIQQNQLNEATSEARKAVELAPGNAQAWSQLATLLVRQEMLEEAERAARSGLAISPFNPNLRLQLAIALIARHENVEGMEQLRLAQALNTSPSDAAKPSKANTPSDVSPASESPEIQPALEAASVLLAQGDLVQAAGQYRTILKSAPDSTAARCGLGQALSKQGNQEDAAEQFALALKTHPDYAPALLQLGVLRAKQGKLEEAKKALSEAARLQPDDAMTHNYLGNVLTQQGRHEAAIAQFEIALRLNPQLVLAHNNLAISCKKLGRTGEAITHYREAIGLDPDFLEALNNLAWLLATHPDAQFRNGPDAVKFAARACELTRHQSPVPLMTLAAACAETGRFGDAISNAERAQQLSGGQGAAGAIIPVMLEAFRSGQPFRAN